MENKNKTAKEGGYTYKWDYWSENSTALEAEVLFIWSNILFPAHRLLSIMH